MSGESHRKSRGPMGACLIGVVTMGIFSSLFGWGCRRAAPAAASYEEEYKDRYFLRAMTYNMMDEHMVLTDHRSPTVVTLDPWLEVVFAAADGQRTAGEFIEQLKAQYPDGAPANLAEQTYEFLAKMEAEEVIRLAAEKTQLPYYLSMPFSELDKERATVEMKRDGFIK